MVQTAQELLNQRTAEIGFVGVNELHSQSSSSGTNNSLTVPQLAGRDSNSNVSSHKSTTATWTEVPTANFLIILRHMLNQYWSVSQSFQQSGVSDR